MTEYKTLDEIEAVVLRVKLQLLRGYTYPSEGQWRDDLEDLAAALRSAVGMVRKIEVKLAEYEQDWDQMEAAGVDAYKRAEAAEARVEEMDEEQYAARCTLGIVQTERDEARQALEECRGHAERMACGIESLRKYVTSVATEDAVAAYRAQTRGGE
jgi:chromosome segregation ATPase